MVDPGPSLIVTYWGMLLVVLLAFAAVLHLALMIILIYLAHTTVKGLEATAHRARVILKSQERLAQLLESKQPD